MEYFKSLVKIFTNPKQSLLNNKITDIDKKTKVINLTTEEGNNFNSNDLKERLKDFQSDNKKSYVIQFWLNKEGNNFGSNDLKEILKTIDSDYCKEYIIKSWLQKEGNNFNLADLKEILGTFKDDYEKGDVIQSWLNKGNNNFELKDLKHILKYVKDFNRAEIITTWFNKQNDINGNNLENNLRVILQEEKFFDIYNFSSLFNFIQVINPQSAKIKAINYIGISIYNNDYIKREFYLKAISIGQIKNATELFDSGFSKIKTDDIYLGILKEAKQKRIIDNIELLDHLKNKKASKFSSLQHLIDKNFANLNQEETNEIFINNGNNNGLEKIKGWFTGNNPNSNFDIKNYNLTDIINYAYFNNDLVSLQSILQPKFLKRLQESYKPNDSKINNQQEINKIAGFIGLPQSEIEEKFIRISDIADKFKDLFKNVKEATIDDVNNSKFIDDKSIKPVLLKAIKKENITDNEIKSFYKKITELEINQGHISKLSSFINGNIDLLCYILVKDDGLATLSGIMSSLNDGCVANIANQLNNVAISFLLKDQENNQNNNLNLTKQQKQENQQQNTALTILYQSLSTDIIPIITKNGDILGRDSGASLIKNSIQLKKFYISPNLLNQYIKKYTKTNGDHLHMLDAKEQDEILKIICDILNITDKYLEKEVNEAVDEEYKQAVTNKTIKTTIGEKYIEYKDLFGKKLQENIDNILSEGYMLEVPSEGNINPLKTSQFKGLQQLYHQQ